LNDAIRDRPAQSPDIAAIYSFEEAERLEQVERGTGGETRPYRVADVPVNLRMHEDGVERHLLPQLEMRVVTISCSNHRARDLRDNCQDERDHHDD